MAMYEGDRCCPEEEDEIFMSDTDDEYDFDEAYEFAMNNPLLSSEQNYRIIDILPNPSTENAPPPQGEEYLRSLINELQIRLSYAKDEIKSLTHEKYDQQKLLEFMHSIMEPPFSVGLGNYSSPSSSHETVPPPAAEIATRETACQTEGDLLPQPDFMAAPTAALELSECGQEVQGRATRVSRTQVVSQNPLGRSSQTILPMVESSAEGSTLQLEAAYARFNECVIPQTLQADSTDEIHTSLVPSFLSTIVNFLASALE
jgi:hypothetical protein